jgi:hypothetical protein
MSSVWVKTGGNAMVEFETVKAEEIKFGKNNFLEIARKRAIVEEGGNNEFISISRGFFRTDGSKTFKKSIAIPDDASIKKFLAEKVAEL